MPSYSHTPSRSRLGTDSQSCPLKEWQTPHVPTRHLHLMDPFIQPPIHEFIYSFIHRLIHSVCPPVHLCVCPYVHMSVCLSVCLFSCSRSRPLSHCHHSPHHLFIESLWLVLTTLPVTLLYSFTPSLPPAALRLAPAHFVKGKDVSVCVLWFYSFTVASCWGHTLCYTQTHCHDLFSLSHTQNGHTTLRTNSQLSLFHFSGMIS